MIQKEKRKDQEKITASTQKERLINISVQLSNIEEIIKVRNSTYNTHSSVISKSLSYREKV